MIARGETLPDADANGQLRPEHDEPRGDSCAGGRKDKCGVMDKPVESVGRGIAPANGIPSERSQECDEDVDNAEVKDREAGVTERRGDARARRRLWYPRHGALFGRVERELAQS